MTKVKDLVEYIVKALADKPDAVSLSEIEGEASIVLELRVSPEDMGRMIGREGRSRSEDGEESHVGDRVAMALMAAISHLLGLRDA